MLLGLLIFLHFVVGLLGSELLLAVSLLRKVVALIGLFLVIALTLFVMQLEFLSLVVVIVYVGAIAVLFLFVVMLYSTHGLLEIRDLFLRLVGGLILGFTWLLVLCSNGFVDFFWLWGGAGHHSLQLALVEITSGTLLDSFLASFSKTLWTEFLVAVLLATTLLLIGILGSVALTRGMLLAKLRKRTVLNYNGALTNKPYAFRFRAWELTSLKTYDLFDTSLSAILVEVRGLEIMRIVPAELRLPAFPWISDKTRFFFDGLRYQRVSSPLVVSMSGLLRWSSISWLQALVLGGQIIQRFMLKQFKLLEQPSCGRVYVGFTPFSDLREKWSLKAWGGKLGGLNFLDCDVIDNVESSTTFSPFLDLGSLVSGIDKSAQKLAVVLLIGVDLRFEVPRLHLIYRHLLRRGLVRLYAIGLRTLGLAKYNVQQFGINSKTIIEVLEGRHQWLNIIRKLNYSDLTVLWGRGYRGWLVKNRGLFNLIGVWARLYKAKLISLYSDVSTFGSWFVGAGSRLDSFEKPSEGFNLVVNSLKPLPFSQGFRYKDDLSGDLIFASFFDELPLDYKGLALPVPTLLEQESLVIGLEGFTKKTVAVSPLPGSVDGRPTEVRTVRRILAILGRYGFGNQGVGGSGQFMRVVEKSGVDTCYGSWLPEYGDFYQEKDGFQNKNGGIQVVQYLSLWRISNFFQTDPVTRNSKLLGLAAQQFYANLAR